MRHLIFTSKIEQVAAFLEEELIRGRWIQEIPGREELATELSVNSKTVEAALRLLETKKILIPQGAGKRRRIGNLTNSAPPALQIKLLLYEQEDRADIYTVELLHQLFAMGHIASYCDKSLRDLKMDVSRVANYVKSTPADAWVIRGSSQDILQWFADKSIPAFAQFGRSRKIPIAAVHVNKAPAITEAVRKLVTLGHRRIVMLTRSERRKPHPGMMEQAFLDELEKHGIKTGAYHLPDWEDSITDFHHCLDSLFNITPPTALFISEAPHFIAAQQHLARKGILAPEHISLICHDPSVSFSWCNPEVSHINWDQKPIVNSILQWANHIARGKDDRKQNSVLADFVAGGTIGPAPKP